jgi:hypothetical protein
MAVFNIESVIFCDDIRPEINGKYALLGAYAPDLTINQVPSAIACAFFVVGTPSKKGPFEGEFRVLDPAGTEVIKGNLAGNFLEANKTSIPVGAFPLKIEREGLFVFEWKFGNARWSKIGDLRIRLQVVTTQTTASA